MSALENKGAEERKGPHRFKKGTSGNPGGRPKALADVVALAREHTLLAVQALVEVASDKGAPEAARVSASNAILDRGWGKAKDTVALENGENGGLTVVIRKFEEEK